MLTLNPTSQWLAGIDVPEDTLPGGPLKEKRTAASLYPAFQALLNRTEYLRNNVDATKLNSGIIPVTRLPLAASVSVGAVKIGANITLDAATGAISVTSSNVTTALGYTPEDTARKAQANGYASLDAAGKVPLAQLPLASTAAGGTVKVGANVTVDAGTISLTSSNIIGALSFTPEDASKKGQANGYPSLGADGKIPASQIPTIAITDTYVVDSQAAMLALTAKKGDVAVRTDVNKTFILQSEPASSLANWKEILTPTAGVTSVNGKSGDVSLSAADVGATPAAHAGAGGSAHLNATTSTAGFQSASDKAKLDNIEEGAINQATADARYAQKAGDVSQDFAAKTMTMNAGILAAIMRLVVSTPNLVAFCLYDTTKDSDPTWVDRCRHLSWYNEPLNTATRGKTRKPPRFQAIIATTTDVTIFDATDPSLPMWMVFPQIEVGPGWSEGSANPASGGTIITSVSMVNGVLFFGASSSLAEINGLRRIDFLGDSYFTYGAGAYSRVIPGGNIAQRGVNTPTTKYSSGGIASLSVNDVAVTVLPGAPIDPATGLPLPTVVVGTGGGVSVIKDHGAVINSGTAASINRVCITRNSDLIYARNGDSGLYYARSIGSLADGFALTYYDGGTIPTMLPGSVGSHISSTGLELVRGNGLGLVRVRENPTTPANGMVAYVTKDYFSGYLSGDIRRAWLASGTAGTVTGNEGANLITNGTFDTDITGWMFVNTSNAKAQQLGGQLKITNASFPPNTASGYVYQALTLDTNKHYIVRVSARVDAGAGAATLRIGTTINGAERGTAASSSSGSRVLTLLVKPTQATNYITLAGATTVDGVGAWFDNVEVREVTVDADRSVKNRPLVPYGTWTRSAVAPGADLMGYSGFGASNYLEEPYSADLDFGTGDFAIMGWMRPDEAGGYNQIVNRKDPSSGNNQLGLFYRSSGRIGFEAVDSVGSSFIAGDSDEGVLLPGRWSFVVALRVAGTLRLYVDAVERGSIAFTDTLTKANARFVLGRTVDGTAPVNATLALWRIAAFAPTPDQIRAIYEAERHLFTENAKALLGGTSNAVQALTHDPDTDQLYVGTADGVSVFQGLRRVDHIKGGLMTSAKIKAIGAARGAVLIGTEAEAYYSEPERNVREMWLMAQ